MERIAIDTRQLSAGIRDMREDLDQLHSCSMRLMDAVQQLSGLWEGPAHAVFADAFQRDSQWLEQQLKGLVNYTNDLEQARRDYDRCDETVRGLVNSIQI